jgi:hypothetical protein
VGWTATQFTDSFRRIAAQTPRGFVWRDEHEVTHALVSWNTKSEHSRWVLLCTFDYLAVTRRYLPAHASMRGSVVTCAACLGSPYSPMVL